MAKKKGKSVGGSANHKTPAGVIGKGKRIALQPPGHPSGHHDPKLFKEDVDESGRKIRINLCRCGRCRNNGK